MQREENEVRFQKALSIIQRLVKAGFTAYLCGGCVRDRLMNRIPKDYDIATSARPSEVQKLFPRTAAVGAHFGVIVVFEGSDTYEVATFRRDGPYLDHRRPTSVSFCEAREDAQRRDFTVNGLFYDPVADLLIDYVNGQRDITARIIQTIGCPKDRFVEDRLRLLRAIRFACQLGFAISQETWEEVCRMSEQITEIAMERIREELLAMLMGADPYQALGLLLQSGLLKAVLPEVADLAQQKWPTPLDPQGSAWSHTCRLFQLARPASAELAMGMLLYLLHALPVSSASQEGPVETIGQRLRFSREAIQHIARLVAEREKFSQVKTMPVAMLKRFLRQPHFLDHLELHRLDCLISHGNLATFQFCQEHLSRWADSLSPDPLITGDHLITMGLTPGPLFKTILTSVEDAQLENIITTEQEALQLVKQNFLR